MAKSFRSDLYKAARILGTAQAASKGPGALVKRQVRRKAYKGTNKQLWHFLKSIGLG